MNHDHDSLVGQIATTVASFYDTKKPFRIFHGSTNSTRIISLKAGEMVDVSGLSRVLNIDTANQTAIVEPNVPMDKLVAETLKFGLVPPVVMEFPGITVGGGIQGAGGESSSFKWGCFNRIFNWYEMILGNGEVITVSPTKNADLFDGTASSCGSLGIVTSAEIQLIEAKKYVALTYIPVTNFNDAIAKLKELTNSDYDFLDAVMFGATHGVIIAGRLTDTAVGSIHRFTRAHDQWFYLHAQAIDQVGETVTESVPLIDYLFRYDRGAFWVGKFAYERFGMPYNRLSRAILNPIMHTRKLYEALQASGASQQYIVQDLGLPFDKANEFLEFIDASLGIYPLWLCPIKPDVHSPLQLNGIKTPLVINVGVWGARYDIYEEFVAKNRLIEQQLLKLGGKKWFYAHSYFTEDEFWQMYDKKWYDALRLKYHATNLPSVYTKISVTKRHEVSFKKGVMKTVLGRAKLRVKD